MARDSAAIGSMIALLVEPHELELALRLPRAAHVWSRRWPHHYIDPTGLAATGTTNNQHILHFVLSVHGDAADSTEVADQAAAERCRGPIIRPP